MGNFIAFAKRQGWPALVILFGVVMWGYGVATTAYDWWTLGLQPWALQLIGGWWFSLLWGPSFTGWMRWRTPLRPLWQPL